MELTKTMRLNIERLFFVFAGWFCIFFGIFIEDAFFLTYVGTFIIGVIIGQLNQEKEK